MTGGSRVLVYSALRCFIFFLRGSLIIVYRSKVYRVVSLPPPPHLRRRLLLLRLLEAHACMYVLSCLGFVCLKSFLLEMVPPYCSYHRKYSTVSTHPGSSEVLRGGQCSCMNGGPPQPAKFHSIPDGASLMGEREETGRSSQPVLLVAIHMASPTSLSLQMTYNDSWSRASEKGRGPGQRLPSRWGAWDLFFFFAEPVAGRAEQSRAEQTSVSYSLSREF